MEQALSTRIAELVEKYKPLLGLSEWTIRIANGEPNDTPEDKQCKAACLAAPEYQDATLFFSLDRIETGDNLEELVLHEMTHCLTWPISGCANTLAGDDPRLQEWVRIEEERSTTLCSVAILHMAAYILQLEEALAAQGGQPAQRTRRPRTRRAPQDTCQETSPSSTSTPVK